jgi:hypothetical protein
MRASNPWAFPSSASRPSFDGLRGAIFVGHRAKTQPRDIRGISARHLLESWQPTSVNGPGARLGPAHPHTRQGCVGPLLRPAPQDVLRSEVACPPSEDEEADDQENDNQHPILQLDAEDTELLNKKLHRPALLLCNIRLPESKIYQFSMITSPGCRHAVNRPTTLIEGFFVGVRPNARAATRKASGSNRPLGRSPKAVVRARSALLDGA